MAAPNERPTTFLLAEDDDDHAALVATDRCKGQKRPANRLVRVGDGEAALRYLRREPPHEGVRTPRRGAAGPEPAPADGPRGARGDEGRTRICGLIPVVILTSSDDETDRARAYGHHANSYVVKPLSFTQFQQMVRDLSEYWGSWDARATGPVPVPVDSVRHERRDCNPAAPIGRAPAPTRTERPPCNTSACWSSKTKTTTSNCSAVGSDRPEESGCRACTGGPPSPMACAVPRASGRWRRCCWTSACRTVHGGRDAATGSATAGRERRPGGAHVAGRPRLRTTAPARSPAGPKTSW